MTRESLQSQAHSTLSSRSWRQSTGEKAIDSQLPRADDRTVMAVMVAGGAVSVVETHGCSGTESQKKKKKVEEKKGKKRKPLDWSTSPDFVEEGEKRQNKATDWHN